jgi:hypothetical protein
MHNTKGITARSGFTVLLIILVMAVLLFTRGNSIRNVGYNVVHYVTGQEVKLMTAHWEQIETRHYNIRFQPQDGRYADMVGEAAESAYTDVTPIFNRLPQKKTTIIIYPDSASLAQSFGWDKNEKALGVYWGGSIRILSPGQWLPDHDKETFWKEGPMVHEFAHLLVDDITKGNYNRWWTEGIAQYVEKQTTGFEFDDPFANSQDMNYYHFSTLAQDFDNLDRPQPIGSL